MYRLCTTEKTILQQNAIEAAMFVLMEKKSYDDITVTEICQNAQLSRRIFYRLYDSKDDVFDAIIDHALLDFSKSYVSYKEFHDNELGIYYRYLNYWIEKKSLLDVIAKHRFTTLWIRRVLTFIIREEAESLSFLGIIDPKSDIETLIYHLTGTLSLIVYWHDTGYAVPVPEMVKKLYGFTQGLR